MQHMDHDRALLGQPFDPLPLLVDDSDQSLDLVPAVDEALDPHSDQDNMPNDEDADNERMVENLCRDLLAVPSETGATEQTVVRIAQIYAHRLFHILAPHDLALPDSMYMLRRKAGEDPKPGQNKKNDIWPLCPCLGHLFDPAMPINCPECALSMPRIHDPDVVKVAVFDIIGRLKALMAVTSFAKLFHYAAERSNDLNDGDVWGAEILRATTAEDRASTFYLRATADGTVTQSFMKKTTVPYVFQILNYHPRLRKALGALCPAFALPKTKQIQKVFAVVTTTVLATLGPYFRSFRGVRGIGFTVFDAHLQVTKQMFLDLVFLVEDIRGIAVHLNSTQAPAEDGACQRCKVKGITYSKGSTVYLGAITYRPRNDPRRLVHGQYFSNLHHDGSPKARQMIAHLTGLANKFPADKVTKAWSQSIAARVTRPGRGGAKPTKPCFKGNSLYQAIFPDFDYIERFTADPAHEWGNFWIRLTGMISNKGQNSMTLVRWAKENSKLGRYTEFT